MSSRSVAHTHTRIATARPAEIHHVRYTLGWEITRCLTARRCTTADRHRSDVKYIEKVRREMRVMVGDWEC